MANPNHNEWTLEYFVIEEGAIYEFIADLPTGCKGHKYRVLRANVLMVPVYQKLVLVEALTGPDEGLWFCCTPANFSMKYRPAKTAVKAS